MYYVALGQDFSEASLPSVSVYEAERIPSKDINI